MASQSQLKATVASPAAAANIAQLLSTETRGRGNVMAAISNPSMHPETLIYTARYVAAPRTGRRGSDPPGSSPHRHHDLLLVLAQVAEDLKAGQGREALSEGAAELQRQEVAVRGL